MSQIRLYPIPPYDFALSAWIFSRGDPSIRIYRDGIFTQAVETSNGPCLVEVRSTGTLDSPALEITSTPGTGYTGDEVEEEVVGLVESMFNIYDDLVPFYRAVEHDPVVTSLTGRFYGLKSPTTPTVFEALVDSIIEQQISLKAAKVLQARLIKRTGVTIDTGGSRYYCYPSSRALAAVPEGVFRECGMTVRKGEYIRDLSASVVSGELDTEAFRDYDDTHDIIAEMMKIRGIGRWTAELAVIRGIHRLDAFPADDVGLQRILSLFYREGKPVSAGEARRIADSWGPWKGLAAFYFDMAEFTGLTPKKEKKR